MENSQSGKPTKSGGGGGPMLPDSGGKVKKRKNVIPFNHLALLNWDFAEKKIAKKDKKVKKLNYGNHPLRRVFMKEYAQAEGVLAGFGVDSESASDLSCGIGVSEMAECWEKVQRTSARPNVDLVPGGNGTGTRLTCADT